MVVTTMQKLRRFIYSLLSMAIMGDANAAYTLNLTRGVTPISHDIYQLHMIIFYICCGIGLLVFSVLMYALIFHRKSRGAKPADFHEHPGLEVAWAVVPFIILVAMAIPATKVLMHMDDTSEADLTIKITGFQWKWKYDYLDKGISFFSNLSTPQEQIHNGAPKEKWYLLEVDHPVVVPINEKIRFLVTANDVIHSWWVPALGIKRDAIPGFIHEAWARIEKPGTYRGQCAELCGVNHAYMPIVVEAKSEEDFDKWISQQTAGKDVAALDAKRTWKFEELMTRGKDSYGKYCAACHQADGKGQPPIFPALKGSSMATGKPISRHIDTVLKGVNGTAMQAFGLQLNDVDIAAIITYERNAWENNTGDIIQPMDVKKAR